MNKVLEYIIRAKDATASAITSVISRLKNLRKHADDASKSVEEVGKGGAGNFNVMASSAKRAAPAIMAVTSAVGSADGAVGKLGRAIGGIASMGMMLGPVGLAIAGLQTAVGALFDRMKKKADEMVAKAKEAYEKTRDRFEKAKEWRLDKMRGELDSVTKAADRAIESLDRMAKAREALTSAKNAKAGAAGEAEIVDMRRKMEEALSSASDEDRARVSAAWQLKIAERRAELEEETALRARTAEAESLKFAERRAAIAERNAKKLDKEAERLRKQYEDFAEGPLADDPATAKRMKDIADAAKERANKEWDSVDAQRAMLEAAREEKAANDISRGNRIEEARTEQIAALRAYEDAEREYAKRKTDEWEKAAQQAEREEEARLAEVAREEEAARKQEEAERLRIEKRVHDERVKLMKAQLSQYEREYGEAEARLANAQEGVSRAWGWYRDKDSLAAQIAEEKADAEARKQYEKDFGSLRDRRRDWRTATNLSLDDEAVRRVALAKEEEAAAQRAVEETAENTRRAAASLAAIEEILEED